MQDFARKLFGHYTSGILTLLVQVGHETGLFEAAAGEPGTSREIAERAGLNERYVREWLGAMVTGRIVDYDAKTKTYALPVERAVFITRAAGIDNLATFTQFVALLGTVNPVASSYFDFSVPEPTGVVGIVAPETPDLLDTSSWISVTLSSMTCGWFSGVSRMSCSVAMKSP